MNRNDTMNRNDLIALLAAIVYSGANSDLTRQECVEEAERIYATTHPTTTDYSE